jgi:hypothetical protein
MRAVVKVVVVKVERRTAHPLRGASAFVEIGTISIPPVPL